MSTYYFWNTKIAKAPDYTLASDKFFGSLLYKYNKATAPDGDRFSWIDKDYKNNSNIKWNITKFVIDREGKVVARFELTTNMKYLEALIEKLI